MRRFVFPSVLAACWLLGVVGVLMLALKKCDGHLMYALDDPYIHLAVGETILKGGYGVDITEHSAPSSSILYPYLMALGEAAGSGVWTPFIANLLPMAVAVWTLGLLLEGHVLRRSGVERVSSGMFLSGLVLAGVLCLLMNAWGLLFLGMEHSLHVMLVLLSVLACVRAAEGRGWPVWLVPVIVVLPLVRFEALAMSAALCMLLAVSRQWKLALTSGALLAMLLCGWYAYMHSLGLPLLPSSVLMKSSAASTIYDSGVGGRLAAVLGNFWTNLRSRQGGALAVMTLLLGTSAWRSITTRRGAEALIALLAATVCACQEVFGRFGWFSRYEIYAMTLAAVTLLWLWRDECRAVPKLLTVAGVTFIVAIPYLIDTIRTPAAARNVYQQQYQMHRFVTDFHVGPVAVNDLGWVSYKNENAVLDLFGLGSEEVRGLKRAGRYDAQAIQSLMDKRGIGLAMVYEDWLPVPLPESWNKVAVLKTSMVSSYGEQVSIFQTRSADLSALMRALCRFQPTLPVGARLLAPDGASELVCEGQSGTR